MIKLPSVPNDSGVDIKRQIDLVKANESLLSYAKSISQSPHADLLKSLGESTVADAMKEFLAKQKVEQEEQRINKSLEAFPSQELLLAPVIEQRRREKEMLDLSRRQAVATEAALAEARQQAADSARETRRAYAIAVVGCLVGLAGLLLTIWPSIVERFL